MKIRTKLLMGILILFLLSQGISMVVLQSVQKDYEKSILNLETALNRTRIQKFEKQLRSVNGQNMDSLEKETVLRRIFRQNMESTAALYQGEWEIYNHTSYDFSYEKRKAYLEKKYSNAEENPELLYLTLNKKALCITCQDIDIWGETYQIYQVSDLSFVKEILKKNTGYGLKLNGVVIGLGAVILYLLLKEMLRPLERLTKASGAIAEGNYSERVSVMTTDEVGILTEQFNKMAAQIEEKIESLKAMNEQQQRLIGSLSHEIKTPMTAIAGYTQLLRYRSDLSREQTEKALLYMDRECRRLTSLSGKMMELCGLYQETKIDLKEENIASIVRECLENMAFRMKEAGVAVELVTDEPSITYQVDRDLFMSYVWNILENAVRASSSGERITIHIETDALTIADEGIGIPEEDLNKVTEAFYMVEKSRSRKEGGAGLGLSLCSRIAQVHGAAMEIESRIGEGTAVTWRNGKA